MPEYETKKADPLNKTVLRQDKLFVRGKLQTQFSRPRLPDSDKPTLDEIPVSVSKEK